MGHLAELLGHDPELLRQLPARHRAHLDSLSQAWLVSCTVLAFPLGVAVWLVEHSLLLSLLASAGTFVLVLNLLRLVHAGSGTAPELTLKRDFRPSLTPMAMIFGLAVMLSQPAQLLHSSQELQAEIRAHRAELIDSHLDALAALGGDSADTFTEDITKCEFVVLRLQMIWNNPFRALAWTFLYVGLATLPALLGRTTWLQATRAYERIRYRTQRRRLHRLNALADREVERALHSYESYRPPWPFPPERPLVEADTPARQGARP